MISTCNSTFPENTELQSSKRPAHNEEVMDVGIKPKSAGVSNGMPGSRHQEDNPGRGSPQGWRGQQGRVSVPQLNGSSSARTLVPARRGPSIAHSQQGLQTACGSAQRPLPTAVGSASVPGQGGSPSPSVLHTKILKELQLWGRDEETGGGRIPPRYCSALPSFKRRRTQQEVPFINKVHCWRRFSLFLFLLFLNLVFIIPIGVKFPDG